MVQFLAGRKPSYDDTKSILITGQVEWFNNKTRLEPEFEACIRHFAQGLLHAHRFSLERLKCQMQPLPSDKGWSLALKQFLERNLFERLSRSKLLEKCRVWRETQIETYVVQNREYILADLWSSELFFRFVLINLKIIKCSLENWVQFEANNKKRQNYIVIVNDLIKKILNFQTFKLAGNVIDKITGLEISFKRYKKLVTNASSEIDKRITETINRLQNKCTRSELSKAANNPDGRKWSISFLELTAKIAMIPPSALLRSVNESTVKFDQEKIQQLNILPGTLIYDESGLIFSQNQPRTRLQLVQLYLKLFGQKNSEPKVTDEYLSFMEEEYKKDSLKKFLKQHSIYANLPLLTFNSISLPSKVLSGLLFQKKIIAPNHSNKVFHVKLQKDPEFDLKVHVVDNNRVIHILRFLYTDFDPEIRVEADSTTEVRDKKIEINPEPVHFAPEQGRKRANTLGTNFSNNPKSITQSVSLPKYVLPQTNVTRTSSEGAPTKNISPDITKARNAKIDWRSTPETVHAAFHMEFEIIPTDKKDEDGLPLFQQILTISNVEFGPIAPPEIIKNFMETLKEIEKQLKNNNNSSVMLENTEIIDVRLPD